MPGTVVQQVSSGSFWGACLKVFGFVWGLLQSVYVALKNFFRSVVWWVTEHKIVLFLLLFGTWSGVFFAVRSAIPLASEAFIRLANFVIPDVSDVDVRAAFDFADTLLDLSSAKNLVAACVSLHAQIAFAKFVILKAKLIAQVAAHLKF